MMISVFFVFCMTEHKKKLYNRRNIIDYVSISIDSEG